jgi:ABC-type amino acid transport substrate-binding protein
LRRRPPLCWSAPAGAGTIDRLKQDKTLRIAYREDAPPFSFTDSPSANPRAS